MEIKPLAKGIELPPGKNQFDNMDFLSELSDSEKIIKSQTEIGKIYPLIKILSYTPTYKPSNFNEQFCIFGTTLYAYIAGSWRALN